MKANERAVRLAVVRALACATGLAMAVPATALANAARFDIAAQPLPKALQAFAEQTKMQLLYRYDVVSRATAHAVHGRLDTRVALDELLEGTGLTAIYSGPNTVTIRAPATRMKDPPVTGAVGSEQGAGPADAAGTAAPQTAVADSGPPGELGVLSEVVVVGRELAISQALQIEKNSSTFVNVLSATDIGAFPASSASSALQLIPGVLANRLQSNDDSTHPSGEATNVLIRGLPEVYTEFNGRDTFSADSGRGLNFNDISPELLGRIEVYKNATADMIEGGIAGTVNLVTRTPFDHPGPTLEASLQGDYTTPTDRATPVWSVLASDTWNTGIGKFGLLADYARSHVTTRVDSVIMDKIDTYCSAGYGTASQAIVNANGGIPCSANPFGGSNWVYAPDGVRYSEVKYDRHRTGTAVAAQYESNDDSVLATLQYTDSVYHNPWIENASHAILDGTYFGSPAFDPRSSSLLVGSSPLVFGPDGMLQSGLITQPYGSWGGQWAPTDQTAIDTGSAVPGEPFVNYCSLGDTACESQRDGMYFQNESRYFDHGEGTRDISGHVQWRITPRLHADFDAQYVGSWVTNNDILVATGSMANYQYSTGPGGIPEVALLPGSNVNYAPGGLANPHNYWIPFIQGHMEDDDGVENAYRADFKYDINPGSWLDSVQAGVRFANRRQTVRYSAFNWTPIAASWSCNGPGFNADDTTAAPYPAACGHSGEFEGYGAGLWGTTDFNRFYNGSVYPNGSLVFANDGAISDYSRLMSGLSGANTNSPIAPGYVPICDRSGNSDGCFQPSEVEGIDERTKAVYAMLNFGGEQTFIFNSVNVVGNAGVRVVRTEEDGNGNVEYPTANSLALLQPCGTALSGNSVVNPSCYLTPAVTAFSNGGGAPNTDSTAYTNWLPSFNVRFGLDSKDFIRFAYSRAMSRADMGYLRNFVQISSPIIDTSADSPYVVYSSPTAAHTAANVTGYNFVFTANAGNTELKPEMADQIDLSFERYFGKASAFTTDLFYKRLSNTLNFAKYERTFTNNGATENVEIMGPVNEADGGTLKGAEVDYETFFRFVPAWLRGLGAQANYTFVETSGIHNNNLIPATSDGGVGAVGAGVPAATGVVIDSHQLAGVSRNSYNITALYERGPIGARLTYDWRSRYLTDNLDCCIGLPVFQKAAGFLNSSIHYAIGRHVELSFDVSNILDTTLVYQQEIFGDSSATPGAKPVYLNSAWSDSGRRYQLTLRAKF